MLYDVKTLNAIAEIMSNSTCPSPDFNHFTGSKCVPANCTECWKEVLKENLQSMPEPGE